MIESAVAAVMLAVGLCGLLVYLGSMAAGMIRAWFHIKSVVPDSPRPHAPQRKGANMRHMERFE